MHVPIVLDQHVFRRFDFRRKVVWCQFLDWRYLFPIEFGRLLGVIRWYFIVVLSILGCHVGDSSEEHAP